jgi:hypothetical protein
MPDRTTRAVTLVLGLLCGCTALAPGDELPPGSDASDGAAADGDGADVRAEASTLDASRDADGSADSGEAVDAADAADATAPDSSDGSAHAPEGGCDATCGCADAASAGFSGWYRLPALSVPQGGSIAGAADGASGLALFAVDASGHVVATHASMPSGSSSWSPWAPASTATRAFAAGAALTAVPGATGGVDVYGVDSSGAVVMLPASAPGAWVAVGSGAPAFPAQQVAVVPRDATHLSVVALSGGTAYVCDGDGTPSGFSAWSSAPAPGVALDAKATSVTAIAHTPTLLDVLALEADERVESVSRDYGSGAGVWQPWKTLGDPINNFPPGSIVSPVSRLPDQVDLFLVGTDQGVWTNFRNDHLFGGAWYGWYAVPGAAAQPGTRVVALAQTMPSRVDLFVVTPSGAVSTSTYLPSVSNDWSPWLPPSGDCGGPAGVTQMTAFYGAGMTTVVAVDAQGAEWAAHRAGP